jgi:hypothetical protein
MASKMQWVFEGSSTDPCCCEEEPSCCMYPADGLGDTYEAADLPDAVTINWPDHHEGSAGKSGDEYTAEGNEDVVLKRNEAGTAWILEDSSDPENVVTRTVGNCLIRGDGNITPGDDLVEDQFEDSYLVDDFIPAVRWSLCVWDGWDEWDMNYGYLRFDPEQQKWTVEVGEIMPNRKICTKTGNQNTPVGSYSGTAYSWNGTDENGNDLGSTESPATATVSEP